MAVVVAVLTSVAVVAQLGGTAASEPSRPDGTTVRVSVDDVDGDGIEDEGLEQDGTDSTSDSHQGRDVAISDDGRFVAFESQKSFDPVLDTARTRVVCEVTCSVVPRTGSGQTDIYLRDRDVDVDGVFDEPGGVDTILVSVGVERPRGLLECEPNPLQFPSDVVGGPSTIPQSVICVNNGTGPLDVSDVFVGGGSSQDFAVSSDGCTSAAPLAPNGVGKCELQLTFGATEVGERSSTLVLAHDGENDPTLVPLVGNGESPPPGKLSCPPEIDFGVRESGSLTISIWCQNTGGQPLTIPAGGATIGSPSSPGFEAFASACTAAPGDNCSIGVKFSWTNSPGCGLKTGTLVVSHTGSNSPTTVPLTAGKSGCPRIASVPAIAAEGEVGAAAVGDLAPADEPSFNPTLAVMLDSTGAVTSVLVAFESEATNLWANSDDNGFDSQVFVRTIPYPLPGDGSLVGATTRISKTADVTDPAASDVNDDADHVNPSMSGDGNTIAFEEDANCSDGAGNVGPADFSPCGERLWLFTRDGASTAHLPVPAMSEDEFEYHFKPSLSANGDHVAFEYDIPAESGIAVWDVGTVRPESLVRDVVASNGNFNSDPSISGDGQVVAFEQSNYNPDVQENVTQVYALDRASGEPVLMSATPGGAKGNHDSIQPAISADGRYVAFATGATNLHDDRPADGHDCPGVGGSDGGDAPAATGFDTYCDILVRDRLAPAGTPNALITVAHPFWETDGGDPDSTKGANGDSFAPALSEHGRHVAFDSDAFELTGGEIVDPCCPQPFDDNDSRDAFVRDLLPNLVCEPATVTFGPQFVGDTATETVECTNVDVGGITIGGVLVDPAAGSFRVATGGDGCTGQVLHHLDSCFIDIDFVPGADGPHAATLSVIHDGADGQDDVKLNGRATAPNLECAPAALDFGTQIVGNPTGTLVVTCTNVDGGRITIADVLVAGPAAGDFGTPSDLCTGQQLLLNQTCVVNVTFTPTTTGSRLGVVKVVHDGEDGEDEVDVKGTGGKAPDGIPAFNAQPNPVVFAPVIARTTTPPSVVTARNEGTAPLTISAVEVVGPNANEFTIAGDGCALVTLAPSGTCTVTVTAAPALAGPRSAALRFTHTAHNGPQNDVGLQAAALEPTLEANPGVVTTGEVVTIKGTNWPTDAAVGLHFSPATPDPTSGPFLEAPFTATVKPDGTFVVTAFILPHSRLGGRAVNGASPHPTIADPALSVQATAPLLIVAPTMQRSSDVLVRN